MRIELREYLQPKIVNGIVESKDETNALSGKAEKNLYLSGIFLQGGVRNANQRIYPVHEIAKAVRIVSDQLGNNYSLMGHADHPEDLNISIMQASHEITKMWMEGPNGYGKMRILPTPSGNVVRVLLENGIKLGVSSRGTGNVKEDGSGEVSDFEMVTIDIVATPSAPGAYPTAIYEQLMNTRGGYRALNIANEARNDPKLQKYLQESLIHFINGLK